MVDLVGAFLLDPVAATVEEMRGGESGQSDGVGVDRVVHPGGGGVQGASDEHRRLNDGGRVPRSEVFPVPVHVPITVECRAHAGAFELSGVDVQVVLVEPERQRAGGEPLAERAAAGGEMRVGHAGGGHRVAGERGVEPGQPAADVRFDLGLGPAGLLEVADVELLLAAHPGEDLAGPGPAPRRVGDAQQPDRGEHLRPDQGAAGGDVRTPVVTDDDRGLLAEGVHHRDVVLDQFQHPVGRHPIRPGRTAVSAHVHRHRPVSGRGQCRQLVAPGVPGLRKPVHQQHQRPGAPLHQMGPARRRGNQTVRFPSLNCPRHESPRIEALLWRVSQSWDGGPEARESCCRFSNNLRLTRPHQDRFLPRQRRRTLGRRCVRRGSARGGRSGCRLWWSFRCGCGGRR
uniref:FunU2 n=1 Tax=Streptosporangium sp. KD35 TaxID=2162663 RepID=A0A2U9KCW5_9ACTN|nr:FunU2 [Streptosporangium sp. KD35]